jgi:hypothetical protein
MKAVCTTIHLPVHYLRLPPHLHLYQLLPLALSENTTMNYRLRASYKGPFLFIPSHPPSLLFHHLQKKLQPDSSYMLKPVSLMRHSKPTQTSAGTKSTSLEVHQPSKLLTHYSLKEPRSCFLVHHYQFSSHTHLMFQPKLLLTFNYLLESSKSNYQPQLFRVCAKPQGT